MSDSSAIEWTDATWNPVRGCSIVSKGCTNCYAMKQAHRFSAPGQAYAGLTTLTKGGPVWTGEVALVTGLLTWPITKKKPVRIFVNSMSDLFHENVPFAFIDQVFAVMRRARDHTFQVLTKRPQRMLEYLSSPDRDQRIFMAGHHTPLCAMSALPQLPLRNVWLGVSVEDQATADERIPLLLQTPAAVRWISAEPLLGPILLQTCTGDADCELAGDDHSDRTLTGIDWVVAGGESGHSARPMHPDWIRSLRDQCQASGMHFFFKQWGEWIDETQTELDGTNIVDNAFDYSSESSAQWPSIHDWPRDAQGIARWSARVGKRNAGRLLDGREWNEYPT